MGVASYPGDVTFGVENIKVFVGLQRIKPGRDVNVRSLYTGWEGGGLQGGFCVILCKA